MCLVAEQLSGLVLTVSLSEDSFFAPGQTFVFPYPLSTSPCPPATCGTGPCTSPSPCATLPDYGIDRGEYLVDPASAQTLGWNLGNPGLITALPVHVAYRPLWSLGGSAASAVDAASIGLPLAPLDAYIAVDPSLEAPPGPNGGPALEFLGDLQSGIYERTITPDPPFDRAFPPAVARLTIGSKAGPPESITLDSTKQEPEAVGAIIPTFDISRFGGSLNGWTAYLRDATTLRRISPVVALSGNTTKNVVLPTNHHPPGGDALTNAQLILAPPEGQPIPTARFAPQPTVLSREVSYPALPYPVLLGGTLTDVDGMTPVEADLVFEAVAIGDKTDAPLPSNFEYTARVSALIDPSAGASSWLAILPPGEYRVTARPLDTKHTVKVLHPCSMQNDPGCLVVLSTAPPLVVDVTVPAAVTVAGSAALSDGTLLAGATVQAVPSQCADGQSSADCMPRGAQTTTAADGSFKLLLDLGGYWLRVEPQDGTGFPWVVVPLVVAASQVPLAPIVVPAPVYAGLTLSDSKGNPIVNALVRVYQVSTTSGAVEVGRALTDETGHYDLYLPPQ
jgi:hypothetical protein